MAKSDVRTTAPSATARAAADQAAGDEPRTRGGWTPSGTAAKRRETSKHRGTPRGHRRRQEILEAARTVFERDGYLEVNVDDIVREAGIARGSFYTYFTSKIDAFQALENEMRDKIYEAVTFRTPESGEAPVEDLREANRRYIELYRANAAFYALVEQVAGVDEETNKSRREGRENQIDRIAHRIRVWQDLGYADSGIEPEPTAAALVSMTSNQCYWWFTGSDNGPEQEAIDALNDIWVRALGLQNKPRAS
ncbi:TetR/AcrR family transcriptional regulator [Rhodococcus artemisiae]|uniref:TetR/AcrR family transcriptional regulator n=1 Tax=Rhodococcus artemisiae TaxID=714159 RepID=A0ABU7LDZ9_9NOCA|nr:TetR/AcrR family transcriptional regulator [Rhodococcus artemisiae]MEE2059127.1 TetR/AcrR family transcriptional regulator [Rhodococcus artemisiae]